MAYNKFVTVKIDDKELKRIKKDFNRLNATEITYGWINGKKYPKTSKAKARRGETVASVAYRNEYGGLTVSNTGQMIKIPRRPYFAQSIHTQTKFLDFNVKYIYETLIKGGNYRAALDSTGQDLVDSIKKSVSMQNQYRLDDKTVRYKGHSNQWTDSGIMLNSLSYKVKYTLAKNGKN